MYAGDVSFFSLSSFLSLTFPIRVNRLSREPLVPRFRPTVHNSSNDSLCLTITRVYNVATLSKVRRHSRHFRHCCAQLCVTLKGFPKISQHAHRRRINILIIVYTLTFIAAGVRQRLRYFKRWNCIIKCYTRSRVRVVACTCLNHRVGRSSFVKH